jgi:arginine metabolism regulation protein II
VLCALLANSAFQADRSALSSGPWREIAVRHQVSARKHLRNALRQEAADPKHAPYKELLMTILAVAMISLFNGAHTFKSYLLDAEKLIRMRGFSEHKSFAVRLLHHMYTHLRIIIESISSSYYIEDDGNSGVTSVSEVRVFRVAECFLNYGINPAHEKEGDAGYNDIHLDVQGRWSKTLYPSIYNMPESLMTLLSQTVSHANEKPRLESIALTNFAVSSSLASRVKTLESNIWSWELPSNRLDSSAITSLEANAQDAYLENQHSQRMILAFHQALILYFYRRIYNMNAMILQERVSKVFDYLEPCLTQELWNEDQDFATGLSWSIYVASCEAMLPSLQQRARTYLKTLDQRGVLFTPRPATEMVDAIWRRQVY